MDTKLRASGAHTSQAPKRDLESSRDLARAMGGEIAVDSAPGQGARFTLTLAAG